MARTGQSGVVHLDTHIVCWLYEGRTELLSAAALRAIESGVLQVSPVVRLELDYLHEIGRITRGGGYVLNALARDIDLNLEDVQLIRVMEAASALNWTRDPFDRMIVAHSIVADAALVTKDTLIREHFSKVVW